MNAVDPLHAVYSLLAKRDLAASMQSCKLARAAIPRAEGATLLALQEAVTDALNSLLMELGEHGLVNVAQSGLNPADIDVQALADECAAAWQEVKRLRDSGLSSSELIRPYVGNWMDPIGSPDWLNRMRLGIPRRKDPKWVARVSRRLAGDDDEDEEE
ncbi:MAG: hypothetical protein IT382_06255 [Deltaproteobacteria bacterium]|nr:hypothetical protein [Deltaproteobacteria bacterium]